LEQKDCQSIKEGTWIVAGAIYSQERVTVWWVLCNLAGFLSVAETTQAVILILVAAHTCVTDSCAEGTWVVDGPTCTAAVVIAVVIAVDSDAVSDAVSAIASAAVRTVVRTAVTTIPATAVTTAVTTVVTTVVTTDVSTAAVSDDGGGGVRCVGDSCRTSHIYLCRRCRP